MMSSSTIPLYHEQQQVQIFSYSSQFLWLISFHFCAADSDYESVSTVLTFSPTPVLAIICPQIPIVDDAIPEPDETFEIQVSTASCLVAQSTFTVTIQGTTAS